MTILTKGDRAAVIEFEADFVFKRQDQAAHLATALIEDGRFAFTWTQEMTETSEQWRVGVSGPWADNLRWMAEEAMKVDADSPDKENNAGLPESD